MSNSDASDQITTLVIQNVPVEYTQDELIDEVIAALGSSDVLDFFYLPWDAERDCNVGYAFANFLSQDIVQRAFLIFCNYRFQVHNGGRNPRFGKVAPAHIQGLETIIWHFQECALEGRRFGPIVVWKGHKIELSKVFEQLQAQVGTSAGGPAERLTTAGGVSNVRPAGVAASEHISLPAYLPRVADSPYMGQQGFLAAGLTQPPAARNDARPPGVLGAGCGASSSRSAPAPFAGGQAVRELGSTLRDAATLRMAPQGAGSRAPGLESANGDARALRWPGGGGVTRPTHESPGQRLHSTMEDNQAGVVEITVPNAHEDALKRFASKFGHSV